MLQKHVGHNFAGSHKVSSYTRLAIGTCMLSTGALHLQHPFMPTPHNPCQGCCSCCQDPCIPRELKRDVCKLEKFCVFESLVKPCNIVSMSCKTCCNSSDKQTRAKLKVTYWSSLAEQSRCCTGHLVTVVEPANASA